MVLGPSSTALLATIYILITIAAFVIAARVYLRLKIQKRKLLMSDLLMMSAWFAAFTAASFDIILDVKGVLRPEIDYFLTNYRGDIESHEYLLKIMWAGTIPYFTTFYLCKASLLSCYLQLFPRFMKKRRILLWVTIGYCTLSYVATILIQLFFCFPIERNWSITKPEIMCEPTSTKTVFRITWALHFSGNIVLFVIPFLILYKLQTSMHIKISICSVFLLGLVDIAFSLTRFLAIDMSNSGDFRSITLIELWSALDAYIGLVVACLPSLRPYFRRSFGASSDYSYGKSTRPARPAPARRPSQRGFQEIEDGVYIGASGTGMQGTSHSASSPNLTADDAWNDDKKSQRSDIELVPIDLRQPTKALTPV